MSQGIQRSALHAHHGLHLLPSPARIAAYLRPSGLARGACRGCPSASGCCKRRHVRTQAHGLCGPRGATIGAACAITRRASSRRLVTRVITRQGALSRAPSLVLCKHAIQRPSISPCRPPGHPDRVSALVVDRCPWSSNRQAHGQPSRNGAPSQYCDDLRPPGARGGRFRGQVGSWRRRKPGTGRARAGWHAGMRRTGPGTPLHWRPLLEAATALLTPNHAAHT